MAGPSRSFINSRIHSRFKFRRTVRISPTGRIVGMGSVIDHFGADTDGNGCGKRQKQSVSKRDIRIDRPFSSLFCQLGGVGFRGDFLVTAL